MYWDIMHLYHQVEKATNSLVSVGIFRCASLAYNSIRCDPFQVLKFLYKLTMRPYC